MNKLKIVLILVGVVIALFFGYQFIDHQFKVSNISANWSEKPFEISQESDFLLRQALNQPYDYLDRGKQSYVFQSQDKKYVLKFFDTHCIHTGSFPLFLPIESKLCTEKLQRVVKGYRIAWEKDRDNVALIFVQLASNPNNQNSVEVTDRFRIKHKINLSNIPFVIQKKGVSTREEISKLLSKGDVLEAEKRFKQLIDMYIKEYKKGIIDRDHNIMYNTGFIEDTPMRLDAGRLGFNERIKIQENYSKDLKKIVHKRISGWLNRHYPKYQKVIVEALLLNYPTELLETMPIRLTPKT